MSRAGSKAVRRVVDELEARGCECTFLREVDYLAEEHGLT